MTTSPPSQAPLFEDGSENEQETTFRFWPTPQTPSEGGRSLPKGATFTGTTGITPTGRRFQVMLNHLVAAGIEPSTSSPAAIPASHSLSPGSVWARRMTGISGRSLRRWWQTSSLAGVYSRMFSDTSRWGSTRCYLTWKHSVTPAGRSLFLLRPSAPPTGGIASGFWPTPTAVERANEGNVRILRAKVLAGEMSEEEAEAILSKSPFEAQGKIPAMWPTPTSSESTGPGHTGQGGPNLRTAVQMFQTPRAIYGEHPGMSDTSHLTGQAGANAATGQKLSAAWVSRLMGYPDGHLDLDGESDPT